MKISARTRYGMRTMLELAQNQGDRPVHIKAIAEHQDISPKYLEQIMVVLKAAGFVKSIRGSKGGFVLAKSAGYIKLSDIFHTLEGNITTAECIDDNAYCQFMENCVMRRVWQQVEMAIENVLGEITLQDLVDKTKKNEERVSYQI